MKLLNKGIICLSLGTAFLSVSCADESPWGGSNDTEGKIELNLLTDAYVTMGTRVDDTKAFEPEVSKFSVSLVKSDRSYNKTWQTVEAFNKEEGFPQGNYTLSAFYGDKDTEGFEKPYYYGETNVQVELGKTTAQTVTAVLSNALLSVRYSDDLKDMFKSYSAAVQTEGHSAVVFAYNEDRPAYLYPGKAKLTVTLSNNNDDKVTLNPADILMTAKHHYIVTIGVKAGETGKQLLDVQITEDIFEEDPIEIVLSDDLFTFAAPTVEAFNFTSNEESTIFETFFKEDSNPEFHIVALGGIKKATLTLTASGDLPIVGGESYTFDLVASDDVVKGQLNDLNIKCFGLFEDSDKMAVVNLKGYERILPEGSYTATLSVTDNNGKTNDSEPENLVVYKIKVLGLDYELVKVEPVYYLDNTITVTVNTHCEELKDKFIFTTKNRKGELVQVSNYSVASESESESNGLYSYTYKLSTDEINDCEWLVKVGYKDRKTSDKNIDVVMPTFKVETDAFAKRVKLRISEIGNTNKPDYLTVEKVIELLRVQKEGADLQESYINKDTKADNIFTITGLNPKNSSVNNQNFDGVYDKFVLYLGNSLVTGKYEGVKVDSFTTEEALDVPNGDFIESGNRIYIDEILSGGIWNVPLSPSVKYYNMATIDVTEPKDWATLNDLTCWAASDPLNTWFVVPSTFIEFEKTVLIRSVGYNHNGNIPAQESTIGQTSFDGYNRSAPLDTEFLKLPGELFLGSYDYNNAQPRNEGDPSLKTRPSGLTFNYSYNSVANEKGVVEIVIFDKDNKEIKHETLELTSENQGKVSWGFNNYDFGKYSDKIYISFKSSNSASPQINIPTGDDLKVSHSSLREEGSVLAGNKKYYRKITNEYKALATGSELRISNVHFIYE